MGLKLLSIRMTSIACLLVYVVISGNSDELDVLVVDPSWHGTPPVVSLEDPEVLAERNARVFELEGHCESVGDLPGSPDESCIARLTEYFAAVPIWRATDVMVYEGTYGRGHWSAYDRRSHSVFYDEVDYVQEDIPTWGDIFDGREEERLRIVASVFADPACLTLREQGGIQPSYANRCAARELFKYARYLEGCMTGFSRSEFFNVSWSESSPFRYERVRERINPTEVVDYRNGNGWQLVENYLLSIWVTQQCTDLHSVAVDEYTVKASTATTDGTFSDMLTELRPMYDASMAIAARAGDPWAIQSYYEVQLYDDVDYWRSLYEINPLLFHRWMSSTGYGWFNREAKLLHARRAYALSKELLPRLESVPFDEYLRGRPGHYSDAELKRAQLIVDRGILESELEYPWDRVPDAFKEIQRNLHRNDAQKEQ